MNSTSAPRLGTAHGMSDERRKKPLWPWIVATVVVVPALYVASFGPACWLVTHGFLGLDVGQAVFRPIALVWEKAPSVISVPIYAWARVFEPLDPVENRNNEPPCLLRHDD